MTDKEKAHIILEALDESINVNWAFEEVYIKAIMKGLEEARKQEQDN